MKNLINSILAVVAPLTSAPTAWAIFAGITENRTAIPMNDWIAGTGAISILLVDVAAALLMTDAYNFSQSSKNEEESKMVQPLWWSVLILAIAISSEIFLSLVIVVVDSVKEWGVLVFPLMTLAGAFTVAARIDLTERQNQRKEAREEVLAKKREATEKASAARRASKLAKELEIKARAEKEEAKRKRDEARLKELQCKICNDEGSFYQAHSKKELAGHMRKHPIALRENAKKEDGLLWTCGNCQTVNNSERKNCRNCGKER